MIEEMTRKLEMANLSEDKSMDQFTIVETVHPLCFCRALP